MDRKYTTLLKTGTLKFKWQKAGSNGFQKAGKSPQNRSHEHEVEHTNCNPRRQRKIKTLL